MNNRLQNNRQVSQSWNNATGNRFKRATGGQSLLSNTPGSQPVAQQFMATGGQATPAPTYILTISNASNAAVSNFDIFGANTYLYQGTGGTWNAGSFTLNGVTISSTWGTVTYQQILANTVSNPFTAGGVYIRHKSGTGNQSAEPYIISTVSPNGAQFTLPVSPTTDAYQFQSLITYNTETFNMDGMTKLTWNTLEAGVSFEVRIYPSNVINPSQALNGNNVANPFVQPSVIGNLNPSARRS